MTTDVAVAIGERAVADLAKHIDVQGNDGRAALAQAVGVAVGWRADSPWVQVSDDGHVLVVLDGSLHNASVPPSGQAEFLLKRYRERDVELARDLLGDFVIVVLDRLKQRLVVARDPVGVRPWYQADAGAQHAGASDIATLLAFPWVDRSLNERTAVQYLAAIEESTGETLYKGISTLRPARTWTSTGGRTRTFAHHVWDIGPDAEISWDDAVERCREVLTEAVRCRVAVADSATSQLSGGLDSSAIVGTAAMLGPGDLVVGRLLFDTPRADERIFSDAVIEHWGIAAVSTGPWIPTRDERDDVARRLGRPAPDAHFTMFQTLYERLAAQGRHDGLTGLGGDDAFMATNIGPRVTSAVQLRRLDILKSLLPRSVSGARAFLGDVVRPTLGYFAPPRPGHGFPSWVRPAVIRQFQLSSRLRRRPTKVSGVASIDERLGPITSGYDASILETAAAVLSLTGKRDSHPFLDPRFIRATYGLDPWWPMRDGHDRALEVAAFSDRLPRVVLERRTKADFSEVFWPQVLNDESLKLVRVGSLAQEGWLDGDGFELLVVNAKRGMANAAIPLFRCIELDRWLRSQL